MNTAFGCGANLYHDSTGTSEFSDNLVKGNRTLTAAAMTIHTDTLGEVTIVGPGAGRRETGFSLLNDLIQAAEVHQLGGLPVELPVEAWLMADGKHVVALFGSEGLYA